MQRAKSALLTVHLDRFACEFGIYFPQLHPQAREVRFPARQTANNGDHSFENRPIATRIRRSAAEKVSSDGRHGCAFDGAFLA